MSVPVLPVRAEVREADLPLVDVQLPASRTAGTVIQYTTNIPSTAYSFYFVQFSSLVISFTVLYTTAHSPSTVYIIIMYSLLG